MSDRLERWWKRSPADLSPEIFWLYLFCCWLAAVLNTWLFVRRGDLLSLGIAVLFAVLGVQALWVLARRRRSRRGP